MIPAIAREASDAGRCVLQNIAFSPQQTLACYGPRAPRLPVKLHATVVQPARGQACRRARRALRRSSRITDDDGVAAMARAGSVAVLLPGAFYVLREKQLPPVDACDGALSDAIATDSNPGTHPITSLLMTMKHGGHAVSPHHRRGDRRRHPRGGDARSAARSYARSSGQMVRPRIWDVERPASSSTASASSAGTRGCGEAHDRDPRSRRTCGARGLARDRSMARPLSSIRRRCRRSKRAHARSTPSSPEASVYRHQYRLREACQRAHRSRRPRRFQRKHRALPRRRRRRAERPASVRLIMALKLASLGRGASACGRQRRHARSDCWRATYPVIPARASRRIRRSRSPCTLGRSHARHRRRAT